MDISKIMWILVLCLAGALASSQEAPAMLNIFSLDQKNPSAEDWLGIYLRKDMMYNNNQVFKKEEKEQFLFTNDKGHWMIGNKPMGSKGYFFQEEQGGSLPIQEGTWSFWNGEDWLTGQVLIVETIDVGEQAAGSSRIQVIVKEFPDYKESFDNYSFDYAQGRDNHEIESETVAVNEMDNKHVASVSNSDSQSRDGMTMVKKPRDEHENYLEPKKDTNCNAADTLEKVLTVLDNFSDITALTQEVRKLEQKVLKMGKVLRKHGLMEDEKEENNPRSFKVKSSKPFQMPGTTLPILTKSVLNNLTETHEYNNPCSVDKNWSVIGRGCYKIHFEEVSSWNSSHLTCQTEGGELAELNSLAESRAVTKVLNTGYYGVAFWLGGFRGKRWRWQNSRTRVPGRATKWGWAQGYPHSENEENSFNCLAIRGRGEVVGPRNWEDADCQDKLAFICEKDLHLIKKS